MLHRMPFGENYGEVGRAEMPGVIVTLTHHPSGWTTPSHIHEHAYWLFVISGFLRDEDRGHEVWRRAGDAVPFRAGSQHDGQAAGPGGVLCLNVHGLGTGGDRAFNAPEQVRALTEELAVSVAAGSVESKLHQSALLAELNGCLGEPDARSASGVCIGRVIDALDSDHRLTWTLAELSAIAGRHPTHLARAFRRATGTSIGAWTRRRRVLRVSLLLRQTATSLAEIAAQLGYADQAHMTREFRAVVGCTPGRYRTAAR